MQSLNFSGPIVFAASHKDVTEKSITYRSIIVNLSIDTPIEIEQKPLPKHIGTWTSTTLEHAKIQGENLRFLEIRARSRQINCEITKGEGWQHLSEIIPSFPKDTPLFKSPQDTLSDSFYFDPLFMCGQIKAPAAAKEYRAKVNLWFAPAGTDCGIHNQHSFLEIHTQISGLGWMQKFRDCDRKTIFEDQALGPGHTHVTFASATEEGTFEYPWHQYFAETDCVWLAIEFHQVIESDV